MDNRVARLAIAVIFVLSVPISGASQTRTTIDPDDPLTVPRIALTEFQQLHAKEAALVVDVRTELEFSAGRIPGAVSVPLAETEARVAVIRDRAKGRVVVFYCSCPSEHSSALAALILHKHGVKDVRALVGGYPEWVKSGGRIER